MIESVDGAIAIDGRSGGLGGPPDRRVYLTLRSLADVIVVAAGTMRAENYGPVALPDDLQAARVARGQPPLPRIAVVSRAGNLDWGSRFFTDATTRPILVTTDPPPGGAAAVADLVP